MTDDDTPAKVPCALDAAYARNSEPFTGFLPEGSDDDVPSEISAWALEGCPVGRPGGWQLVNEVALQSSDTAVRVLLSPAAARALAAQLEAAADEIDPYGQGQLDAAPLYREPRTEVTE
jgi:hypothetical protein